MGPRSKIGIICLAVSLLAVSNVMLSNNESPTEYSDVVPDKPIKSDNVVKEKFVREDGSWVIRQHNNDLLDIYKRLKKPIGDEDVFSRDLDSEMFGPVTGRSAKHFWFPKKDDIPFSKLPSVPPAPIGIEAVRLADKLGYPRHWRARMRPKFFILGPPKTGTTFLHDCFIYSMIGNKNSLAYPLANQRWPTERFPNGEPTFIPSIVPQLHHTWNRTGFRRFDLPKESWLYVEIGRNFRYKGSPRKFWGAVQISRFPPVEPESSNWVLTDSTPDYIMIPKAAQALYLDMENSPWKPRFVVMSRDPVSRGFSHFLLFAELKRLWGWKSTGTTDYSIKLDEQHEILLQQPICRQMLYEPEIVLNDLSKTYDALRRCMYHPKKLNDIMFLPFGFTALGLRYWLSLFSPEQFTLLKMSTLKRMNTTESLWDFFEDTFPGMKRPLPRCDSESIVDSETCTPWNQYAIALERCGPNSPALAAQAWTTRGGLNETKGSDQRLEKYRVIGKKWDKLLAQLMSNHGISWYTNQR